MNERSRKEQSPGGPTPGPLFLQALITEIGAGRSGGLRSGNTASVRYKSQ
jgi:hypothetical protein